MLLGLAAPVAGVLTYPLCPRLADKTETFARERADQALLLAAVADGVADGIDVGGERRLGNDPSVPDRPIRSSLLTTRSRLRTRYASRSKTCGPNRNNLRPPGELPPVRVKHAVSEHKMHFGAPWPRA